VNGTEHSSVLLLISAVPRTKRAFVGGCDILQVGGGSDCLLICLPLMKCELADTPFPVLLRLGCGRLTAATPDSARRESAEDIGIHEMRPRQVGDRSYSVQICLL